MGFGVVLGEDGKKFKTRSGDTVRLVDLLDEAVERSLALIEEKAKNEAEASDIDRHHIATVIGYGAVKYADLSKNRVSTYTFSYDRMLSFEGNTAVYMLYAYARIQSILRKAEASGVDLTHIGQACVNLTHTSEVQLAIEILKFTEIINFILKDLMINRLCEYLYDLSCKFSDFYRDCVVIGTPEQDSRLLLCMATSATIRQSLNMLGISVLDKM